jgi:hypothetical protein
MTYACSAAGHHRFGIEKRFRDQAKLGDDHDLAMLLAAR